MPRSSAKTRTHHSPPVCVVCAHGTLIRYRTNKCIQIESLRSLNSRSPQETLVALTLGSLIHTPAGSADGGTRLFRDKRLSLAFRNSFPDHIVCQVPTLLLPQWVAVNVVCCHSFQMGIGTSQEALRALCMHLESRNALKKASGASTVEGKAPPRMGSGTLVISLERS